MNTRIFKNFFLLTIISAVVIGLFGFSQEQAVAALQLSPTEDAYVYSSEATTPHNGIGLSVGYSGFPSFSSNRESYLQYDLTSVTQTTGRSTFNVTITGNGFPSGALMDVSLYSVANDNWTAATITWNNASGLGPFTLLQTVQVPSGTTGALVFGSAGADNPVGTYIEQQRVSDGKASFLLRITGGSSIGFGGSLNIEDSENFRTPAITTDSPFLDMRNPTVVTLNNLTAHSAAGRLPLLAGLAGLAVIGLVLVRRVRSR